MSNWNGKVRCFKDNYFGFIKDVVYNVNNGVIIADNGRKFPESNDYKYIDIADLNEDLCLMFEEVKIPVLCELLGVQPFERFKLKSEQGYPLYKDIEYYINDKGRLMHQNGFDESKKIADIINGYDSIIKLPFYQFNEDELITLKGLYLNNYGFVARDKDGELWAYDKEPMISETYNNMYDAEEWEWDYACKINEDLFQQVQWGNILDVKYELSQIN